jgi:hypothetical protein
MADKNSEDTEQKKSKKKGSIKGDPVVELSSNE